MGLSSIYRSLDRALRPLKFSAPVAYTYNPLDYAWAPFDDYLSRYGGGKKEVVLVGMNPGPWGMMQTGIPFGEVGVVRDWLEIRGKVHAPKSFHPKRPILGMDCLRSEVSGKRLWGWAGRRFKTPAKFFSRFFILNYCPLAFLEESGKNFPADKIAAAERTPLEKLCDGALRAAVLELQPKIVVGVGQFAANRARTALSGTNIAVGDILHPSPASPLANKGWEGQAEIGLRALGIEL